ncbi:PREDICTED: uncharacterized protein LOC105452790 isoform X2 [Wasmannia auropunctata]|uniref:uncharacterized protein LOC105452790 isoform X2 n=1 Tax=Wasmannia auropunctata TaxID=64793 RepID=UPI0005ED7DDD|nr:PREDICTED: uncharacterized protein LOC105452790 isoform X2 [Wasmannia auropunctata]
MEQLRSSNRAVDMSEPILAEDSTFSTIALSLRAVLEQLDEGVSHHDYLVALLLVLSAESGFGISSVFDTPKWEQNTRLVRIPTNWKSQETGDKTIRSMVIQTLRYVNPYTSNWCLRYMNLKEISHRFKDDLVTPLRANILLALNSMGPSLESLPIELHRKIADMLPPKDIVHFLLCSKRLYASISKNYVDK